MPRFSIARNLAITVSTTATPTITATIARRITPTIVTALTALFGAATVALPAAAQLAPPQWSRPAMDSTHVTGTAARVMPEIVPAPATVGKVEERISAPKTISEMLAAFDGVLLDMPASQQSGAYEQMRFRFSKDRMQVQFTAAWNWYDSCAADAISTRCSHGAFEMMLSPEGLSVVRRGCGSNAGTAGGSAEFKWSDYQSFGGKESPSKQWALLRDTFWANCYFESGAGG